MSKATLALIGKPLISVEFEDLQSLNVFNNMNRWDKARVTAEWRLEAREKAIDEMGFMTEYPLIKKRALVIVNVYPAYEEISDIPNVLIKPLLDGFSDADVWVDDEWAWVPVVMYRWAGIGKQQPRMRKVRRTILDVYELEDFLIMGKAQQLPKGRKRL